jgi:hypothetical protein
VVIRGQPESPSRCVGARQSRCRWRHERPPVGKRAWRRGEHLHVGAGSDGVTSAHLALAIRGNQRSSVVISGHQWSSEVTSAHLALACSASFEAVEHEHVPAMHSDALRCTQMHSDALRGTQRHSEARFVALACTIRCHQLVSSAGVIRGHQMSSVPLIGARHQRSSVPLHAREQGVSEHHQRSSVVISAHQCRSTHVSRE